MLPYSRPHDTKDARGHESNAPFFDKQYHLWKRFLKEAASEYPVVTKDTWNQLLPFMYTIDPQFQEYDFDAAWPSVFDEFVEWAKTNNDDKM